MPIKDRSIYPKDWKEISRRIRFERASGKCEECGVENYAIGARDKDGNWLSERDIAGLNSDHGEYLFSHIEGFPKMVKIVLTVAHLNHDTRDNREENLKALCQRCHLRHDALQHKASAARTRLARKEREQPSLLVVAL